MSAERLCKGPLLKLTRSRPTWRSWRKAWFVQYHRLAYRHLRSELHQRRIPDRRLSSDHGARQPHLDGELCTCIRCPQIGAWRGGEAGSAPIWTQVGPKLRSRSLRLSWARSSIRAWIEFKALHLQAAAGGKYGLATAASRCTQEARLGLQLNASRRSQLQRDAKFPCHSNHYGRS
jgi:hypothetical protein